MNELWCYAQYAARNETVMTAKPSQRNTDVSQFKFSELVDISLCRV